jgi:ComF family protein
MSRYMRPLVGDLPPNALLVPVPLHRRRLWSRGFNQSAIVARELSRRTGVPVAVDALRRIRPTPPLKGMGMRQRRRTVAGAFRANAELRGRTVILVDDVLTTGSTANACARVLKRAGAERVDLISWARVVRPTQVDV